MREWFNADERELHIRIICGQIAVEEMAERDVLTSEEKKLLKQANTAMKKFSSLVFNRLGEAYQRRMLNLNKNNVVRLVGKYEPQQNAVSEAAQQDIEPCFAKLQMLCCWNCEKCGENFVDCAVYNMGQTLGLDGHGDKCPYYETEIL